MDCFPPECSSHYRRHWLSEARPVLHAEDRLRSGECTTRDEVWELAMTVTGDEEAAREILFSWVRARVEAGVEAGVEVK